MVSASEWERGGQVLPADSEALLAAVAASTADPLAGVFGPASLTWKINREAGLFLGAGRAALLQLAHPWVTASLVDHSQVLANPIRRFHNTFRIVFTMIFGSLDQALSAARHLHGLHARIRGEMPEAVATFRRGSRYEANDIAALRWVYATLIDTAVLAYECVRPPLTDRELDAYYIETKTLAALFGIPPSALPDDWQAFLSYVGEMCVSDDLGINETARQLGQNVLAGAGSWVHPPHWYRGLTALWIPARFRKGFGLSFGTADRQAAERAMRWLPRAYRVLPTALRFVGPYREAVARLHGRPAGVLAQLGNRFWIGLNQMPFAADETNRRLGRPRGIC